jgi:8-oxo-dGTP diphosphatase
MQLLAGCAVFDDAGRVLLVHRTTPIRTEWEMPGGKVEPGEDPRNCAIREIKEELGVDVEVTKQLGIQHFELNGTNYEYHYFTGTITSGEPSPQEARYHDDCGYTDIKLADLDFSHGVQGLKELLYGKA